MGQQVCWIVGAAISKASPSCKLSLPWNNLCDNLIKLHRIPRITIVLWNKPEVGTFKLNTDGNFLKANSMAGMGGILRNDDGDIVIAVSILTQCSSNNYVEAQVAWFRVNWCIEHSYTNFTLELDSMIMTNMMKKKRAYNYKMNNIIEYTSQMLKQANVNIIQCYGEANQVVDSLAKLAATSTEESYYFSFQQLPKNVKDHIN
ncbi:uncharacterized protein LOC142176658 [Nicotiana tabacum]|uniref:Uncharacterized protein LOC142176658 n=1 Tax=Nicotiana tabacum TaxID=4097 RepID=A0AC58TUG0_TOBAC